MKSEAAIDIKQQLIDLFDREEMLAFFDFQMQLGLADPVEGLCKISEPKEGQSKSNYISILFIIDTVNDETDDKINEQMKGIPWGELKKYLYGINMVIPIPHVSCGTRHYFKEVEIYLGPNVQVSKAYLANELYPAIQKILGCKGVDLVFWDDISFEKKHIKSADINKETDRSLMAQIIDYFKGT